MVNILKKADILRGINQPEHVEIKSLGGYLWLRPLSNKELDNLDEMEAKAMGKFKTNEKGTRTKSQTESSGEIDVAKITKASAEVQVEKVYLGLDNPKNVDDEAWTYEEIQDLPRNVVEEIANKVDELSIHDVSKGDLERFPENE